MNRHDTLLHKTREKHQKGNDLAAVFATPYSMEEGENGRILYNKLVFSGRAFHIVQKKKWDIMDSYI